ncbi:MAG TPA: iron ABC transporter permease [Gaiellaceae bacterium]|nr:iron ABC transporter permease [Gaiellaceae bacterium]
MSRRGSPRPPLALLVPAPIVVALLLLPLVYLCVRALGGDAWDVLARERTFELVLNTTLLVAGVVVATLLVGVPLAWLVTRSDVPGRRIWMVAGALPLVIPSYVAALVLLAALGPRGLLADAVGGLPELRGYWGAVLALTLATYPYVFLLSVTALRALDPALEEAARGLGRSPFATFATVTLPSIRSALGASALLVALYVLSDFGVVSLMNYDALTRAIFLQYRSLFDRDPAAVLALVLVALTAVVLVLEGRVHRGRLYRSTPGTPRRATRVRLGRWRLPALAFCVATIGTFLAMPVAVLTYWLVRGLREGRELSLPWQEAVNSLSASGLAAVVATVAAIPIAVLAVRYASPASRVLERASFAANALPGIVVALSLVFFAARYATPIYQTLALLVFAYVVRFLPQALAGSESALRRVDPHVEEAARSLGRKPLGVLTSVTLPLAWPGIAAGAALVFLSAMKELPATLLLRPIGFDTLATEIWSLTSVAAYSRAAVPALTLVAVSAPLLALLLRTGPSGSAPRVE